MRSPITGGSGNTEFLALLESGSNTKPRLDAWQLAIDALFEPSV